jgi:hypothetical protein
MLGPLNRLVQPKELYAIKKGYHHARSVLDFDDTANTDQWQKEVYTYASKVFEKNNYQSVIWAVALPTNSFTILIRRRSQVSIQKPPGNG